MNSISPPTVNRYVLACQSEVDISFLIITFYQLAFHVRPLANYDISIADTELVACRRVLHGIHDNNHKTLMYTRSQVRNSNPTFNSRVCHDSHCNLPPWERAAPPVVPKSTKPSTLRGTVK